MNAGTGILLAMFLLLLLLQMSCILYLTPVGLNFFLFKYLTIKLLLVSIRVWLLHVVFNNEFGCKVCL